MVIIKLSDILPYQASIDWMTQEILNRHRQGETKTGVPNPTLETMCRLVHKAAGSITSNVARRAFKNTGLTLAIDGSEDDQLSPNLSELLRRFGEDPVPRFDFRGNFFSRDEIRHTRPSIWKIFRTLCSETSKGKEEEFQPEPVIQAMKKDQK